MANTDPLQTIRLAMQVMETAAKAEQRKGDKANLNRMAELMSDAAALAEKLAGIEDRRGISSSAPTVAGLTIELVATPEMVEKLRRENAELQGENRNLKLKQTRPREQLAGPSFSGRRAWRNACFPGACTSLVGLRTSRGTETIRKFMFFQIISDYI